jgi:thiol-disulfide isomerase/thioredoxin
MDWKMILLGLAVVAVLGLVSMYGLGISYGRGIMQGFQSGGGAGITQDTFTMYYADWCGHCQAAKPGFTEFSKPGTISVGGKSCAVRMISPEHNPEAVAGKNLKGYPSFLLETVDGKTVEYTGERTTDGYMRFLEANLGGSA